MPKRDDLRSVLAVLCDETLELRPGFGAGMVTALARVDGRPLGTKVRAPRAIMTDVLGGVEPGPSRPPSARPVTVLACICARSTCPASRCSKFA